jgi:hypothetical protein
MQPVSSYIKTKSDALVRQANYDWFVGSGYDNRIPTSVYYNGFGMGLDDLSLQQASYDPYQYKNTPNNRQNLYAAKSDDGGTHGYYLWEPERAAIDMAPVIPNSRMPGINQIADCITGYQQLPYGHQLQGTRLSDNYVVTNIAQMQRDPGNPIGILFDPPALGPYQRGSFNTVPSFYQ